METRVGAVVLTICPALSFEIGGAAMRLSARDFRGGVAAASGGMHRLNKLPI